MATKQKFLLYWNATYVETNVLKSVDEYVGQINKLLFRKTIIVRLSLFTFGPSNERQKFSSELVYQLQTNTYKHDYIWALFAFTNWWRVH